MPTLPTYTDKLGIPPHIGSMMFVTAQMLKGIFINVNSAIKLDKRQKKVITYFQAKGREKEEKTANIFFPFFFIISAVLSAAPSK